MMIDISNYQGNIDFTQVKKAVEGIIIRCGWGTDSKNNDDPKFNTYVRGCINNGIPFGVYIYSYAKTVAQAQSEAQHVIRLCEQYKSKMKLPVFYDLEQNGTQAGAVERARAWANILIQHGYSVGIYANSNWWKNYLKGLDEFPKWVANYGINDGKPHTKPSNSGMIMWQYTSRGKVAGIKGNVDCDIYYGTTPTPTPTPSGDESAITLGKYFYTSPFDKAKVDMGYVFNPVYYTNHQPDIANIKKIYGSKDTDLFRHFTEHGMTEGRQAITSFNLDAYKKNNKDLVAKYGNNNCAYYEHYCRFGYKEGRKAT